MKLSNLIAVVLISLVSASQAREANHLRGASSPYLLQHLYNPVDWYPWGGEALQKARIENRPIFVSVGYSSCHWCHVMEDESFENEAIASLLNENFVSIKIDRETRPDLDEQFVVVTQILTGTSGWPNSVFLTPEGNPFHAGGYYPPAEFKSVIARVRSDWQQDPDFVSSEAGKVARAVQAYLVQKTESRDLTPEILTAAAESLVSEMDSFHGGYGVAPKFPREPILLFLLDLAQRTGREDYLNAVTNALDGMIKGGIHDQVGGGFHRYAIDPEWHVPHFEKMLYTQALTGRLLVRAWIITGRPRYKRAAERAFDYVLRELLDQDGGFYSAQDADSLNASGESVEGAFYIWVETDLIGLGDDADIIAETFQITPDGDFEGANVLNLSELPEAVAEQRNEDPVQFVMRLDEMLGKMRLAREARPAPFLDRKIILSWNAAMIETLAEAAHFLKRPDYYNAAQAAARFILTRMRNNGQLKRISFQGNSGTPAQLQDHAGLALALIALHDFAPNRENSEKWLREAHAIANQTRKGFGSAASGFRMTRRKTGISDIIPIDDTELPSGNALALNMLARLRNRMRLSEIEQDGFRLAAAISGSAIENPEVRASTIKAIQEMLIGDTGTVRHLAHGNVRVEIDYARHDRKLTATIWVADGWHINANKPLDDYSIPTQLSLEGNTELIIVYPDPVVKSLSFSKSPLALYEGVVELSTSLPKNIEAGSSQVVKLSLQACSDAICLQPENLEFVFWN